MIRINLLPHREEARQRRKRDFHIALVAAALAGFLLALSGMVWLESLIGSQQQRNAYLAGEVQRLDEQIKEISTLQTDMDSLRARQAAVQALQSGRNQPVRLLNELAIQLPDGVYLTTLRQSGQTITLIGQAQSNEHVSELLRNLSGNSSWLRQPQLVETSASSIKLSERDQRRTAQFQLTAQLRREGDADQEK